MPQFDLRTVIVTALEHFVGSTIIGMPAGWAVVSAQCVGEYQNQAMVTVAYDTPDGRRTDTLVLGRRRVAVAVTLTGTGLLPLSILVTLHDRLAASDSPVELPWTYVQDGEKPRVAATRALEAMGGTPGVSPDRRRSRAFATTGPV